MCAAPCAHYGNAGLAISTYLAASAAWLSTHCQPHTTARSGLACSRAERPGLDAVRCMHTMSAFLRLACCAGRHALTTPLQEGSRAMPRHVCVCSHCLSPCSGLAMAWCASGRLPLSGLASTRQPGSDNLAWPGIASLPNVSSALANVARVVGHRVDGARLALSVVLPRDVREDLSPPCEQAHPKIPSSPCHWAPLSSDAWAWPGSAGGPRAWQTRRAHCRSRGRHGWRSA